MLMNAIQGLVADQAQSLMKEHVLGEITKHLDDDAQKELDEHIDKMTENGFKSMKDMFSWNTRILNSPSLLRNEA